MSLQHGHRNQGKRWRRIRRGKAGAVEAVRKRSQQKNLQHRQACWHGNDY